MNKYVGITVAVGALAIAGYFLYHATATQSSECTGTWYLDAINPACWIQSGTSAATSEINTVLIILAVVVVLVVGLLAFGPQTQHIAKGAGALAVL